jgi:hypothetical protein
MATPINCSKVWKKKQNGNWTQKKHYPMNKKELWHISKTKKLTYNLLSFSLMSKSPTWSIKSFFHKGFLHVRELLHGCQALNMSIIWPILVDAYKAFQDFLCPIECQKLVHTFATLKSFFASICELQSLEFLKPQTWARVPIGKISHFDESVETYKRGSSPPSKKG